METLIKIFDFIPWDLFWVERVCHQWKKAFLEWNKRVIKKKEFFLLHRDKRVLKEEILFHEINFRDHFVGLTINGCIEGLWKNGVFSLKKTFKKWWFSKHEKSCKIVNNVFYIIKNVTYQSFFVLPEEVVSFNENYKILYIEHKCILIALRGSCKLFLLSFDGTLEETFFCEVAIQNLSEVPQVNCQLGEMKEKCIIRISHFIFHDSYYLLDIEKKEFVHLKNFGLRLKDFSNACFVSIYKNALIVSEGKEVFSLKIIGAF